MKVAARLLSLIIIVWSAGKLFSIFTLISRGDFTSVYGEMRWDAIRFWGKPDVTEFEIVLLQVLIYSIYLAVIGFSFGDLFVSYKRKRQTQRLS